MPTPAIAVMETFLTMPWKELPEVTTKEAANEVLETIPGFSTLVDPGFHYKFCIQWESVCHSCFKCKFKDPPLALEPSFASLGQAGVDRAS
jgi:hypothetical protein